MNIKQNIYGLNTPLQPQSKSQGPQRFEKNPIFDVLIGEQLIKEVVQKVICENNFNKNYLNRINSKISTHLMDKFERNFKY